MFIRKLILEYLSKSLQLATTTSKLSFLHGKTIIFCCKLVSKATCWMMKTLTELDGLSSLFSLTHFASFNVFSFPISNLLLMISFLQEMVAWMAKLLHSKKLFTIICFRRVMLWFIFIIGFRLYLSVILRYCNVW